MSKIRVEIFVAIAMICAVITAIVTCQTIDKRIKTQVKMMQQGQSIEICDSYIDTDGNIYGDNCRMYFFDEIPSNILVDIMMDSKN